MAEWIGINRGLPPVGETVIAVLSIGWRVAAQYNNDDAGGFRWVVAGVPAEYLAYLDAFVVAWQPMPDVPPDDGDDDGTPWWAKFYY